MNGPNLSIVTHLNNGGVPGMVKRLQVLPWDVSRPAEADASGQDPTPVKD